MAFSFFETEHRVRPDDIDMFGHVHNSRYFDYVLDARYQQMEQCYGMSMEKFMERGFGWVVSKVQVEFKRALVIGDRYRVRTGIAEINSKGCRVDFQITASATGKLCSAGWFEYVMIDLKSGKSAQIPQDILSVYSI